MSRADRSQGKTGVNFRRYIYSTGSCAKIRRPPLLECGTGTCAKGGIHFTVYFYLPQNLVFVSADRSASHGSLWILPCGGVRDGVILAPALQFERYQAGILTHGNISSNQLDRSTLRRLL